MHLTFKRDLLIRSLGLFAGLTAIFAAAFIWAFWFDEGGGKRLLVVAMMPVAAAISIWGFVWTSWLIVSKSPAAVIERDGIRIRSHLGRKFIRWRKIGQIVRDEVPIANKSIEVVEVQSPAQKSIQRLGIIALRDTPGEVDRWIAAAQSRLTVATA